MFLLGCLAATIIRSLGALLGEQGDRMNSDTCHRRQTVFLEQEQAVEVRVVTLIENVLLSTFRVPSSPLVSSCEERLCKVFVALLVSEKVVNRQHWC